MGVFGMLAIALMVFVLRQTSTDARWPGIEKYVKVAFWGTNSGLAMMVFMSLFPGGVLQLWDVVQHGYWHARSVDYIGSERALLFEWLRLPGDLVFILFGAVPLLIASIKGYLGMRATAGATSITPTCISPRARVSRPCGTSLRSSPCHRNARRRRILRITLTR